MAIVSGPVGIGSGVALTSVALVPDAPARGLVLVLGVALTTIAIWISIRLPRLGVHLSGETLRYDGFLVSWSVRRDAIRTVLDDGFVEWSDDSGREHRRQVWMLAQAWEDDGTKFARSWRWRRAALLEVRAWAGARSV